MKRKAVIIDLDSTLYNIDHRLPYILESPKDWKSFNGSINEDKLNKWCKDLLMGYNRRRYAIILLTGRSVKIQQQTILKLKQDGLERGLQYHTLIMRPDGDTRKDFIMKLENYHDYIEPFYDVKLAIDDRPKVIEMWKWLGIQTLWVANGYMTEGEGYDLTDKSIIPPEN